MARKKYSEVEKELMKEVSNNLKKIVSLKGLTQTELSERTGIPTSTISDYMNAKTMISMGNLEYIAYGLNVRKSDIFPSFSQDPFHKDIPLIGTICAGDGLLADQNIEEYIHYPFPQKKQPDYALRVKGDSMKDAGIDDGDIVYMKYAQWADFNGQIVAALVNEKEDGMLKRIEWTLDEPKIKLIPENKKYETKSYFPNQIQICGVYMGHFKSADF
ncbi:LexA repressor [compost metagenome]